VSSDIIPILNRCWENTLNNQQFALKAIRERGWNPLNYVLLDDPRLIQEVVTTSNEVLNENNNNNEDASLNSFRHKNGMLYTSRLNSLIVEQNKCAGRKRKNEELLAEIRKNDGNVAMLVKSINGRPSSGKLASKGVFGLGKE
jgi:hypothetical protein